MAEKSAIEAKPVEAFGWAARDPSGLLSPFNFLRRSTGEHDVQLKILYCGICDWDLNVVRNGFGTTNYPIVPGHEVVGEVTEVGSQVQKFKVGDKVGVGALVGSCGKCRNCMEGLENYCPRMKTSDGTCYSDGNATFFDPTGHIATTDNANDHLTNKIYGGYSNVMVVDEQFVILWPDNLDLLQAGPPLLCAGIVPYSPMRFFGLDKPGMHIGVVGLGGLGHLAVKFGKAFGSHVTVISTSISKKQEAIEKYGVDSFLLVSDTNQMQAAADSMDGIIDTVGKIHPLLPLINMLKRDGKLVLLGPPEEPFELPAAPLIMGRKMVVGSVSGSIKETQEMVDFAAEHGIVPDVEIIPIDYVNTAMERIEKGDVKYRFVIDIGKTLKSD
ncbi:hypothetical protein ACH5RR_012294 [Cinchona calisaya]|uniref:Enoyl reductase (ER) domain-containing protein n=1 Tax=Cinchona calisaya TaxID=153742 RepID=A0ABD3A7W9_9GENT